MTHLIPTDDTTAALEAEDIRECPAEGLATINASRQVTVIEPASRWISLDLAELWRYRDLLTLMIWRDIAARYRQSVVGLGWAIIKPVMSMLIFTFIFGRVAGLKSDGSPYPIFIFAGILPWMFFSGALSAATSSVVSSGHLLKKVYFPRLILPLVAVATGIVELLIQLAVLGLLMAHFQYIPGIAIFTLPVFILIAAVTALACGLWLTALNVKYRDVGQAAPFLIQMWMWLSPIVYSSGDVPEQFRLVYGLNPMAGVIEGFRWSVLGSSSPDWVMMGVSLMVVIALLISGLIFFQKTESTFADII